MPKLPKQTFLNRRPKPSKDAESSSGPTPNSTNKQTHPKQLKQRKVEQREGDCETVHSRVYSLACQLLQLVDSVNTIPLNVYVANARQVLRNTSNQSNMYSLIDSLRAMKPATFSEDTRTFSQDLDEHLHPILSSWYRPTNTPPDGNCLWHMI